MDVRYSPEQTALRESVLQVLHRLGPRTVRDLDDSERATKLGAAVDASGWRELRTAGDDGRPFASGVEVALIAEELGRGLADVSFIGVVLASELRRLAEAPPAVDQETVALSGDLSRLAEPAEEGAIAFDSRGGVAALVPVAGGLGVVPISEGSSTVDLTRSVAAAAGPVTRIAKAKLGESELQRWTALGLALACADLVGIMTGAVDLARDYAGSRRQYGAPIGSFQAVQHLLADALVATEGSRSVALYAAWSVDARPGEEALVAASMAKAFCARAARSVCETAIQVHGGIGNTWDCMAHVYLRRALTSIDLLGGLGPSLALVLDHAGIGGRSGLR